LTEDSLFLRGEEDIGSIVFFQIGSEHAIPGDFEADPFEVGYLLGSGKGEGELGELRSGDHG
jgi:hypothetical protein